MLKIVMSVSRNFLNSSMTSLSKNGKNTFNSLKTAPREWGCFTLYLIPYTLYYLHGLFRNSKTRPNIKRKERRNTHCAWGYSYAGLYSYWDEGGGEDGDFGRIKVLGSRGYARQ